MLNGGWLFPDQQPIHPLSTRQLSRACKAAAHDTEIEKRGAMHTLRHYVEFGIGATPSPPTY